MSAPDTAAWAACALGAVVGALGGLLVRPIIAAVPEPTPEPVPEGAVDAVVDAIVGAEADADPEPAAAVEPEPAKVRYAAIAAESRLPLFAIILTAAAGAIVGLSLGWDLALLLVLPLLPIGTALGIIDARTRLLPTKLVLPGTALALLLGALVAFLADDWSAMVRGLIALLAVRSVFWLLWFIRSAGMGFGDVRLSAALGFVLGFLGWAEVVIGIYAAFLEFVIPSLVLAVVHRDRARLKSRNPFGPFLLLGALTGIAIGPWIARSLGY